MSTTSDSPTWLRDVSPDGPELCLAHPFGEPHLRSLLLVCDTWKIHPDALPRSYGITLDAPRLRTLRAMINRALAQMGDFDE